MVVVIEMNYSIIFLIVVDKLCCFLILSFSLNFTSIAFFSERKVEVMTVKTNPISFSGLVGCASESHEGLRDLFDGSKIRLHLRF